jgi:DNA-binding CsgD family transcriptional regulator/PAS domain-containing protein
MVDSVHDSSFMGLLIASISEAALWSDVARDTSERISREAVAFVVRSEHGHAVLVGSSGFDRMALETTLSALRLPEAVEGLSPEGSLVEVRREHLPSGDVGPGCRLCGWWLPRCVQPAYLLTTAISDQDPEPIGTALVDLAAPVGRALTAHLRLGRAERRSSQLQGLVDRISVGAIVVDHEARILAANRSAESLMANHDELGCWGGLLRARRRSDTKKLHSAIRECFKGGEHRVFRFGDPPEAVQVLVTGTRDPDRRAMVFLMEARTTPPLDAGYLATLYELTPAEIRLIQALLLGYNLTRAARYLELSRNTVHSQLKSIFTKTQTNRQGELIALMLRSPTVMYREPSGEFTREDL